jgi:xanthine phosphoribosyltransferase
MGTKTFDGVMFRFRNIVFTETFDLLVAIANGGVIPAGILNQRLNIKMELLHINLRDQNQNKKYDFPQLISPVYFDFTDKKILLVDDRMKTGATFAFAFELLQGAKAIKTFAVNGNADYHLYDEDCFEFPWNI